MNQINIIIIFILALFLVACTTQEPAGQQETTQQTGDSMPLQQKDATKDFEEIFTKMDSAEWKASYDITTSSAPEKMRMTQYVKTHKNVRSDVVAQGIESRSFILDTAVITCTKMNNEWTCWTYDGAPQEKDSTQELKEDLKEEMAKYEIVADGTKIVADVTAICFKIVEKGKDTMIRYCFSKEGAPLYIQTTSEGETMEMIATSYVKSVSNSDFTPPATPKKMDLGTSGLDGADDGGSVGDDADSVDAQEDPCAGCDYLEGDQKEQCLQYCS